MNTKPVFCARKSDVLCKINFMGHIECILEQNDTPICVMACVIQFKFQTVGYYILNDYVHLFTHE